MFTFSKLGFQINTVQIKNHILTLETHIRKKNSFFHLVHTAQVNSRLLPYGPHGRLPHTPSTK